MRYITFKGEEREGKIINSVGEVYDIVNGIVGPNMISIGYFSLRKCKFCDKYFVIQRLITEYKYL